MRYLSFLALLFLTLAGCIGPHPQPGVSFEEKYSKIFMGTSRDALIIYYGAPSRTTKLDMGVTLMEYKARNTVIHKYSQNENDQCSTRFWLKDHRVIRVDAFGEAYLCDRMLQSKQREFRYDDRKAF